MAGATRPILAVCIAAFMVTNLSGDTIEAFTEPYQEVELAAGDTGILAELQAKPGDSVREGQLLVSLDNRVLEATLEVAKKRAESKGAIDAARAEFQLRQERLHQVTLLRQRGHATQREFSRSQTDLAVAEARARQAADDQTLAELECQRIKAQLSQRTIVSPFSGVVTEVHRKVGEPTLVTDPRILTLAQLDQLRVKFSATPKQVSHLKTDQTVQLVMAASNERINGTVERISRTIDAKSGTVEVHIVINNEQDQIRSGARCLLELDSSAATSASVAKNNSQSKTIEASLLSP